MGLLLVHKVLTLCLCMQRWRVLCSSLIRIVSEPCRMHLSKKVSGGGSERPEGASRHTTAHSKARSSQAGRVYSFHVEVGWKWNGGGTQRATDDECRCVVLTTDTIKESMTNVCARSGGVCSFRHSSEICQNRCSMHLSKKKKVTDGGSERPEGAVRSKDDDSASPGSHESRRGHPHQGFHGPQNWRSEKE